MYIWKGIRYHVIPLSQFSRSVMSDSAIPWTAARQASLSITNSQSLLKLMSIELVMPSNHLILYRPLLLPPSIFPSLRVFSNESVLHIRWSKYCSFIFSISPSNEYSGLIIPLNSRKSSRLNRLLLSIMIFSHEPTLLDRVGFLVTGILPV